MSKNDLPHIVICICTYKRVGQLEILLRRLEKLKTNGSFTYSASIVDNDANGSANRVVVKMKETCSYLITYDIEPEQNIAKARNRVVRNADGWFFALIDDDEIPNDDWLVILFNAVLKHGSDGILAPVLPYYDFTPPAWIVNGRFHYRPDVPSGTTLKWRETRTGNALLRAALFDKYEFDPKFGSGGEDRDLFRRMIEDGHRFIWCAEAPVYESVPPERCRRIFLIKRAILRGKTPYNQNLSSYFKSLIAIPAYVILLPILLILPHHFFMRALISCCDHVGRLLAMVGYLPVRQNYVTE